MRLFTVSIYEKGSRHLASDRSEKFILPAEDWDEACDKVDWMLGYGHGTMTYSLEETDRYGIMELYETARQALY